MQVLVDIYICCVKWHIRLKSSLPRPRGRAAAMSTFEAVNIECGKCDARVTHRCQGKEGWNCNERWFRALFGFYRSSHQDQ